MPRPGRGMPAQPFASWNAERDMWESPTQGPLFGLSDGYSETWPSSGSMRSGSVFPHPTSVGATAADVSSSLLPTPSASLGSNGSGLPPERRRGGGSADGCNASAAVALLPTPSAINPNDGESLASWEARRERVKVTARNGNGMGTPLSIAVRMLPTPSVVDATGSHGRRGGARGDERLLKGIAAESAWGPYAEAIARWGAIHGPAPAPTKTGKKGGRKLNPEFASWMMGAPAGWITDVPGLTDTQATHAIGNGVVPHQCAAALRILLDRISRWDVA